jgi:uncharacterized protein (DUF2126 family)
VPLRFDIIDGWSKRSLGGCIYQVLGPGGQSYDTFPTDGEEAALRRSARFEPFGQTPGLCEVPSEERPAEFPTTLDLRRAANR